MSNQPTLCHRPLRVEMRGRRTRGQGKEGGREEEREDGPAGQVGRVDSAHGFQVSVPGAYGGQGCSSPKAEGGLDRASQQGQLVQVVIDSGKGARSQACSGHEP